MNGSDAREAAAGDAGRSPARRALELPGVLGNQEGATAPRRPAPGTRAARGGSAPGSVRHSVRTLVGVAATAVVLLGIADGVAAAALGLAVAVSAGLCVARHVAGTGARDGGRRRPARLLGSTEPGLGGWPWLVHNVLGADGHAYFAPRLRPQLQRLFDARLGARHGTDLHGAPERARALIGDELWPWIDPSQPPPRPAIPHEVLRALLDRLDALGDPERDASAPASPGPAARGTAPGGGSTPS